MSSVVIRQYPTFNIGSTKKLIFGVADSCRLDEIRVVNTVSKTIIVQIEFFRIDITTEGSESFLKNISIPAYSYVNILDKSLCYLEYGDLLYGNSDFSDNLFNTFISYTKITET